MGMAGFTRWRAYELEQKKLIAEKKFAAEAEKKKKRSPKKEVPQDKEEDNE